MSPYDDLEESQGWASWAWSYVPQILPAEEDEGDEDYDPAEGPRRQPQPPVVSLGFYIKTASVVFKASI